MVSGGKGKITLDPLIPNLLAVSSKNDKYSSPVLPIRLSIIILFLNVLKTIFY